LNSLQFEGTSLTDFLTKLIDKEVFAFLYDPLFHIFGTPYLNLGIVPFYRRVQDKIKRLREFGLKIIQKRREALESGYKPDKKDLLTLLLERQKEGGSNYMSDDEILDQFYVFCFAGIDTTAHTILMMMYHLSEHPEYRSKLEAEVGKSDFDNLSLNEVNKMEFMSAFMKEVLRFHAPLKDTFYREAIEDHYLGDVKVKKGTLVMPPSIMNDFNPNYYDEPEKFYVERWLPGGSKRESVDPLINVPFSAGPRNCIGQNLALVEAKIVFGEILRRFEWKVSEGYTLRMNAAGLYQPNETMVFDLVRKGKGVSA